MPIHIVRSGECLSVIAARYGFANYRMIYNHPDNGYFRQLRPNPNLIYPGDEVVIPARDDGAVEVAGGSAHRFTLRRVKKALRVVIQKHDGTPLGGQTGVLVIGGEEIPVTTDGSGKVEQLVPIDEREAVLTIAGHVLKLRFGHLNPLRDTPDGGLTGAKGRLRNLGYDIADSLDTLDDATSTAVALFQHDHQLAVTGKLDAATLEALASAYGC